MRRLSRSVRRGENGGEMRLPAFEHPRSKTDVVCYHEAVETPPLDRKFNGRQVDVRQIAFTPETQTPVDILPVSKTRRKITPLNAGTVSIQHSLYEQTIIRSSAANMALPPRDEGLLSVLTDHRVSHTAAFGAPPKTGKTISTGSQKVQLSCHNFRA